MKFEDRLCVGLELTRLGKALAIPAGNVRQLSLRLERSGFSGSVEFCLRDDTAFGGRFRDQLAPIFLTSEEMKIDLSVVPFHPTAESQGKQAPLKISGILTQRQINEEPTDLSAEKPLLWRRYAVEFSDPARAYWQHHFPVALLTKKSWLAALQGLAGSAFKLTSTFGAITEQHPQLFIHLPREEQVSFYEFVGWLLDRLGGCLLYDYKTSEYHLAADEASTEKAAALFGDDVLQVAVSARPQDPAQPRILNSYALSAATVLPAVTGAVPDVFADHLLRSAVLAEQNATEQLEVTKRDRGGLLAKLVLGALSPALGPPGSQVVCHSQQRFAAGSLLLGGSFRIHEVRLEATASGELDAEHTRDSVAMSVGCVIDLKQASDVRPVRRQGVAPRYPGLVEGLVVSQRGAESDITWDMVKAEGTQAEEVVVNLPLFNESVSVPFEPGFDSFNTYRPRARNERVLVALDLHRSRVARTLSFRAEAILSSDVCGEQMVFGKSAQSITKMSHQYAGEEPVFDVLRAHDKDHVRVTLSEGKLTMFVAEQES